MQLTPRHRWDVTPKEAVALQKEFAAELSDDPFDVASVRLVAGVDVSVKSGISRAAVVVMRLPDFEIVESLTAERPTPFPYVPGLLTFREGPVLEEVFARLESDPGAFLFDGMGRIHPRRMGIAAHMGLWLARPTVGVGKTHFLGDYDDPAPEKGSATPITHKGDRIGTYLRTRTNVKPVYVSAGNRCDLPSAKALVLAATGRYRLPEPIRVAHRTAGL